MSESIIFTKTLDVSEDYYPKPSSQYLPEWYKKTGGYMGGKKDIIHPGQTNGTIKKCIPVFDALTAGYIITTSYDIFVKKDENGRQGYITSNSNFAIQFHSIMQAPYHPRMNHVDYPKIINPWAIKTPKGYSCLFIPPVHGGNGFFTIAEGFVDTDTYTSPVNFPFVINDLDFEGLIPAGTPICQVIPIKRNSWKIKIGNEGNLLESHAVDVRRMSKLYDAYKSLFWNRKEYL